MLSPLTLIAFADHRLLLFDQSDFGAKKGWYVAFENNGPDGAPLPVDSLRLILGIGDGQQWHFVETKGFGIGQNLEIGVHVGPEGGTLSMGGKEVARIDAKLVPIREALVIGRFPEWANAATTYRLQRGAYRMDYRGGAMEGHPKGTFPPGALEAFERPLERKIDPKTAIERADLSMSVTVAPPPVVGKRLIDAYGQVVGAHPNPVRSDADLRASVADEVRRGRNWVRDARLDPYGGVKTARWHEKPTGFYRVTKRGAKWWLVSPQGNPLFYTGLCTAPAPKWDMTPATGREELFTELPPKGDLWAPDPWGDDPVGYFTPIGWSLKRKYGPGWDAKARASMKDRLARWGFSGMGKWAEPVAGVPRVEVLTADWPKLSRHLDPFDPKARAAARASLERQLAKIRQDPWVVGTSIGNEYDEIVTLAEIAALPDSPAKEALRGLEPEAARHQYATAYYRFLYETVKSIDPNHLYFGFWISVGWWQNESDWDLIAPWCDVLGYDRYSDEYTGMEARQKRVNKPTLLGEYAYPAWYGGTRGYGRYNVFVETDADSGRRYAATVEAASRDPYCVGALWFQYRDEPVTGRGPGKGYAATLGEHYAFGFVDVNDRPKWDLVARARDANREAVGLLTP